MKAPNLEGVAWPFATAGRAGRRRAAKIVVTGAAGRLGRLVCRMLATEAQVVALDRRAFPAKSTWIDHRPVDLRSQRAARLLERIKPDAVIHLGVLHDLRQGEAEHHAWNVSAFSRLLEGVSNAKVPRLIVLSSADVYGPQPDNPLYLTEDAPLLGAQRFGAIRDLITLDLTAQSFAWRAEATETVLLRPCHIVGAVRNAASNYFRLEHPVTLWGYDPLVQLIHERDVVSALIASLAVPRGVYNVAGPGAVRLSDAIERLGGRRRPFPLRLARGAVDSLWGMGLGRFPAPQLEYIRFPCTVDDGSFRRVAAWSPERDIDAMRTALRLEPA